MKRGRKLIYSGISICLLVIFMCGCQKNSRNTVVSQHQSDQIELKFFGFKTEAVNVQAIEEILQDYMKENPHINITYESVKGVEYYDILSKRITSGNLDDIFMIDEDNLKKWKHSGIFEDLGDLSSISNYSTISYEQMKQSDGSIPFVPTSISAFGLYCNMDLLKQHQQNVPKNNEEFMEVCQYFVDQGITPIIANNDISLKTVAIAKGLSSLYQSDQSEEAFQQRNQDPTLLYDELTQGYAYVQMLIDRHFVDASLAIHTEKTKDDLAQFEKGEQPFMLTGAWAAVRVEKDAPDLNFQVYPYPILDDRAVLVTNIDTRVCVNAKGAHVKEAKKFMEYLTREDVMWKFVNSQASFSPLKETRIADDIKIQPLSSSMNEETLILGSDVRIQIPLWSLTREGMKTLLEGKGVKAAMDLIQAYEP